MTNLGEVSVVHTNTRSGGHWQDLAHNFLSDQLWLPLL